MAELIHTADQKPPDINNISVIARNIIFILTAAVSFALWLSSTITTPKRIDKLEEAVLNLNYKQNIIETQTNLIYGDLKEIKTVIINRYHQEK